jgi:hypothetical protein
VGPPEPTLRTQQSVRPAPDEVRLFCANNLHNVYFVFLAGDRATQGTTQTLSSNTHRKYVYHASDSSNYAATVSLPQRRLPNYSNYDLPNDTSTTANTSNNHYKTISTLDLDKFTSVEEKNDDEFIQIADLTCARINSAQPDEVSFVCYHSSPSLTPHDLLPGDFSCQPPTRCPVRPSIHATNINLME